MLHIRTEDEMPKFIIEREMPQVGKLTDTDFEGAAQKSCDVLRGLGPEVQWIERRDRRQDFLRVPCSR
jgi:hypothetical protein